MKNPGDIISPVEEAFGIPLILQEILKKLSVLDLLRTSMVNRYWCLLCREILRDYRKCFASVPIQSCWEMGFRSVPTDQQPDFVNGIVIDVRGFRHEWISCEDELDACFVGPFKHLIIRNLDSIIAPCDFFVLRFLRRIVRSIETIQVSKRGQLKYIIQAGSGQKTFLPSLRLLTTEGELIGLHEGKLEQIKTIIRMAPNLSYLDFYVNPSQYSSCLTQNNYKIVKKLDFRPVSGHDEDIYEKFSLSQPKLVALRATTAAGLDPSMVTQRGWMALERMLISSCFTLTSLDIHAQVALKLQEFDLPPLKTVTNLKLELGCNYSNAPELFQLCKFNFTKTFPNVGSVALKCRFSRSSSLMIMETGESEMMDEGMSSNVRELCVEGSFALMLGYIKTVFPHVTSLVLNGGHATVSTYGQIFQLWSQLQRLVIGQQMSQSSCLLDGAFCGVSDHEIQELARMETKFLETLNLVPAFPALTYLKELKELEIEGGSQKRSYLPALSQKLVFQRMPKLRVNTFSTVVGLKP